MKPYKHFGTGLIILACIPLFFITTLLLMFVFLMAVALFIPTLGYSWNLIRGYEYWYAHYTPWGLFGIALAGESLENKDVYFLVPYKRFLIHSKGCVND